MAKIEKVTGDLTLDPTGNINLNSNTIVNGDLTVVGSSTSVETTNTEIADRQIVLNKGESGTGVTGVYSGIEIERGSTANAWFVFDESTDTFRVSTDGGVSFVNVLTGVGGSGMENVVEDTTPQLGGDLETNGYNIVSAQSNEDIQLIPSGAGRVTIDAPLKITHQDSTPAASTDATIVYAGDAGSGGSGVFFVNGSTSDELVSKTKAIVYGIIF